MSERCSWDYFGPKKTIKTNLKTLLYTKTEKIGDFWIMLLEFLAPKCPKIQNSLHKLQNQFWNALLVAEGFQNLYLKFHQDWTKDGRVITKICMSIFKFKPINWYKIGILKFCPGLPKSIFLVSCRQSSKLPNGTMECGGIKRHFNYFWSGRPKICQKIGQKLRLVSN